MIKNFNTIWNKLMAYRNTLDNLYDDQNLKLAKIEECKSPSNIQLSRMSAYREQIKDIRSFINDINELIAFASPDIYIVLVQDIDEYDYFIAESDAYEKSYEGDFAKITWLCKFPYRECFLVWLDNPATIRRLKGRYLP